MAKLITLKRAAEEIKRLQEYISLVESYEADTIDMLLIKEYAKTNSLKEAVSILNTRGYTHTIDGEPIDQQYAVSVIKGKTTDELHKILKSGYLLKTRKNRNRG
ncbi:hypothetical protein CVD25_15310 [Bacillus canaveralius]|uniref:Uncharacterized protein n=1 Tax=Bacillus canaveralius TaxID=1403243 RepID=A0A2N5GK71_9BACI|nr:hypothetical protein [Bacillus canaveralius]PLR81835.1 hypothetical protein CU635_13835 [Bacillus canaveralius]PLR94989.1 hypothetical protein CVD25_15310 [Bacillus canaveralius]